MNINFQSITHSTILSFLQESFLPSLTSQQKRIIAVATIAFTCLAVCFVMMRSYCFKTKDVKELPNQSDEIEPQSEVVNELAQQQLKSTDKDQDSTEVERSEVVKEKVSVAPDKEDLSFKTAEDPQKVSHESGLSSKESVEAEKTKPSDLEIEEEEEILPLKQPLTTDRWIMQPAELMQTVFGEMGPREDWEVGEKVCFKILHAGSFLAALKLSLFQSFCKEVGLPEPARISIDEYEGAYKTYIVLNVPAAEWIEKIEPIRNLCKVYKNAEGLESVMDGLKDMLEKNKVPATEVASSSRKALKIYLAAIVAIEANLLP